ncbi:MAG TPA: DUF4870 domain-containing protein [Gemmatimonadaceae bacterium]|nr:DUF4870 domain-containing protein [Gemmatimonadaceae bacterium]
MTGPTETTAAPVTSTGLAANLAGALAYLLGPITGIAFLVLEKENRFVRFHAAQSIAVGILLIVASIALSILSGILAVVPVLGWIAALLAGLAFGLLTFVLWVMLMWRAWNGREWEVPVAGGIARSMAR